MEQKKRETKTYHELLQSKIDEYVHDIYRFTKQFPKEELYGVTSQIRRSALSVALNYVEGYARGRTKVHKNFLEISYGSLKESLYLWDFSYMEGYISGKDDYEAIRAKGLEIGAMLWGILRRMQFPHRVPCFMLYDPCFPLSTPLFPLNRGRSIINPYSK